MEMREKDSMGVRHMTSASLPLTCGESALSCWRCSGADGLSMISWRKGKASGGRMYSCSSVRKKNADIFKPKTADDRGLLLITRNDRNKK